MEMCRCMYMGHVKHINIMLHICAHTSLGGAHP